MGKPRSGLQFHARLSQAMRAAELVQIDRSLPGADPLEGYVVQLGPEWVLLSVLRQGAPDGWTALRTMDVTAVEPAPSAPFVQRGLRHRQDWPPPAPRAGLNLWGDVGALLGSAAAGYPLFLLYTEQQDPVRCLVGRPVALTPTSLEWLALSPAGVWDEQAESWQLSSVTRVDLGSQYELALARAAQLQTLVTDPNRSQDGQALRSHPAAAPAPRHGRMGSLRSVTMAQVTMLRTSLSFRCLPASP